MGAVGVPRRAEVPPAARPVTRILILSEIRLFRESLGDILGRERGMSVGGLAGDLAGAMAAVRERQPDLLLLDAALPQGARTAARIRDTVPHLPVVVLAVAETPETIIAWAEAGVAGYVPRTAALADLAPLLRDIMRGEQRCEAAVAAGLLRRVSSMASAATGRQAAALTVREREIVQLIGTGLSNKDIARRLNIGLATTKSHVHNLLGKLKLQRRGQAASWMREHLYSTGRSAKDLEPSPRGGLDLAPHLSHPEMDSRLSRRPR